MNKEQIYRLLRFHCEKFVKHTPLELKLTAVH